MYGEKLFSELSAAYRIEPMEWVGGDMKGSQGVLRSSAGFEGEGCCAENVDLRRTSSY